MHRTASVSPLDLVKAPLPLTSKNAFAFFRHAASLMNYKFW